MPFANWNVSTTSFVFNPLGLSKDCSIVKNDIRRYSVVHKSCLAVVEIDTGNTMYDFLN